MIITAGKFKGLKIEAPNEKITRPTLSKVRMAVFNTLHAMTNFEGKSFLDMYAGSGIMGLEAYSRGFGEIVEMESDSKVFSVLKKNYSKFERASRRSESSPAARPWRLKKPPRRRRKYGTSWKKAS